MGAQFEGNDQLQCGPACTYGACLLWSLSSIKGKDSEMGIGSKATPALTPSERSKSPELKLSMVRYGHQNDVVEHVEVI